MVSGKPGREADSGVVVMVLMNLCRFAASTAFNRGRSGVLLFNSDCGGNETTADTDSRTRSERQRVLVFTSGCDRHGTPADTDRRTSIERQRRMVMAPVGGNRQGPDFCETLLGNSHCSPLLSESTMAASRSLSPTNKQTLEKTSTAVSLIRHRHKGCCRRLLTKINTSLRNLLSS